MLVVFISTSAKPRSNGDAPHSGPGAAFRPQLLQVYEARNASRSWRRSDFLVGAGGVGIIMREPLKFLCLILTGLGPVIRATSRTVSTVSPGLNSRVCLLFAGRRLHQE